jgi:hypothetical protein
MPDTTVANNMHLPPASGLYLIDRLLSEKEVGKTTLLSRAKHG